MSTARRRTGAPRHGWQRRFRGAPPTTFQRCLAVHMVAADRWPRRNRLPKNVLAKCGHFIVGAVLGAVVAAIVLKWMTL